MSGLPNRAGPRLDGLREAGSAPLARELMSWAGKAWPGRMQGLGRGRRWWAVRSAQAHLEQTLAGWAGACASWRAQGLDVYCYFDNDASGHAVANARSLRGMLADRSQGARAGA